VKVTGIRADLFDRDGPDSDYGSLIDSRPVMDDALRQLARYPFATAAGTRHLIIATFTASFTTRQESIE
jgi:hypothetical protein